MPEVSKTTDYAEHFGIWHFLFYGVSGLPLGIVAFLAHSHPTIAYFLFLLFLNIYFLLQSSRSIKRFQCLLIQWSVSSARCSFVLLNFDPNPWAQLDVWKKKKKTLKLHQLQQIILVWFEIYIRKLIIIIEYWFWSFDEGMNGITDAHIFEGLNGITDAHIFVWRANVRVGYSIHTFIKRPKSTFNS